MFIRRIDSSKAEHSVGGSTKRIVVFLFGALFAFISIAALVEKAFGVAALLGIPALILFAITLRVRKKSVTTAHDAASVAQDITSSPVNKRPNKAPEPTTFAVTSRAIVRFPK